MAIRFAVDMITLYDTDFWEIDDFYDFYNPEVFPPKDFWDKALDSLAETGIEGIRITFGPSHWKNALAYYGSGKAFGAALTERKLTLCSGFNTSLSLGNEWRPAERQEEIIADARAYAEFLADAGASIMVVGLPARTTWSDDDPVVVDAGYAQELSSLLNRMGYETLKLGVKLAIHPKTHGVFWLERDIDLFMMFTDPVYVFLCPDTAHISLGGGDPAAVIRRHAQRVVLSDWKDISEPVPIHYVIDENHLKALHPHYAQVGKGRVDWISVARALGESDFDGWAILELDAAPNPVEMIKESHSFVRNSVMPWYR